ncbi:MAG: lipase [Candidatus Marinimicrobia bacterium]|nr:lipase [Candidatus Neomarinimicrobiota bacterium]
MIRRYFHVGIYLCFSGILLSQNNYPIILIHGFLGWGRDEMAGYYYWGGKTDLEAELQSAGHEVYTVSVGPISPNWDRAIEAFYQIKGGQVDYGNEKAENYDIIQKPVGKNHPGFYPQWSAENPVHLIGHSQGGSTAKMLEVLLQTSFEGDDSPLLSNEFAGWIASITTISTPHNGTTLVPLMLDVFPFALNLAPWFGGIDNEKIDDLYSFDLEHWHLEKRPNESLKEYYVRIAQSPVSNEKNLCTWDLSIEGAAEFNNSYHADKDVYYFSIPTFSTIKKNNGPTHKPDKNMSFHLWPIGMLIGSDENSPDSSWYENDGICNTVSMTTIGDVNMPLYSGKAEKGSWVTMPRLNYDHQAIVGHNVSKPERDDLIVLYKNHCKLLYSLK